MADDKTALAGAKLAGRRPKPSRDRERRRALVGAEPHPPRDDGYSVFYCGRVAAWRQILWLLVAAAAKGYDARIYGRFVSGSAC
jgi:hypothetical protein